VSKASPAKEVIFLSKVLAGVNTHLYFWGRLLEARGDGYCAEIARSLVFWDLTIRAHARVALLSLACIYDYRSDADSIPTFLKKVARPDTEPDRQELQRDRKFCSRDKPDSKIDALRKWRDEYLAHHSKNPKKSLAALKLGTEDVQHLTDKGFEILQRWGSLPKESPRYLEGKESYDFILDAVRAALHRCV